MDIDTLFGLPAHPLVVHGAVVLLPLAAIGTVVVALRPRWRRVGAPIVLALALGAFVLVWLAQGSGEELIERVRETELVERHEHLGEDLLPWAFAPVVVAAGLVALDRLADRRRAATTTVTAAAAVVALVVGGAATWKLVEVGHSGSKAVWSATVDGG